MNTVFLVVFALLLLVNLLLDFKRMRKQNNSLKWLYITVYVLTSGLYISILLEIKTPMPTRFFINQVSPWVLSLITP